MTYSIFLTIVLSFGFSFAAEKPPTPAASQQAPATAPAKPKSQFNSQVYEQSAETESFSAIVKVVREVQGETEIFFEGKQGFYTLASDAMQAKMVKSQQKQKPVQVEIDTNARKILKAEFAD